MTRHSAFDNETDLDLSQFATKTGTEPKPSEDLVRRIADAGGFPSRAPVPPPRQPRTYRTGRNVPFATKVSPETIDTLYAIADQQGWRVNETLERAVAALAQSLDRSGA